MLQGGQAEGELGKAKAREGSNTDEPGRTFNSRCERGRPPLGCLPPETSTEPPASTTDLQNREVHPLAVLCLWYFIIAIIAHEYTRPRLQSNACSLLPTSPTPAIAHMGTDSACLALRVGNGKDCITRFRAT